MTMAGASSTWSERRNHSALEARRRIVGRSPALLAAAETAGRLAPTGLPLLILGDTGVGKELMARYVHAASGRGGPLVAVDCGAVPSDLAEALLFGHRKGAFTGATESAEGLLERAHGGTLFLDELGSLPLRGQAKLLRALETGEILRVGETRPRRVDFRVIAAMQTVAAELLRSGAFRYDLLQRVAGAVIRVPPLSERSADIEPLVSHFAALRGLEVSGAGMERLRAHPWPGNVRELRWTVERAAILEQEDVIGVSAVEEALAIGVSEVVGRSDDGLSRRSAELAAVCREHDGDPDRITAAFGIGRSTLYRWLKDAGLELRTFRGQAAS